MNDIPAAAPRPPWKARTKNPPRSLKRSPFVAGLIGFVIRGAFALARRMGRPAAERFVRRGVRVLAPLIPETRTARRNIALAFPEKTDAERSAILKGSWDNLARAAVEFAFLEEISPYDHTRPTDGYFTVSGVEHFASLRDDGKTAVIFGAHLANWELVAVAGHANGLKSVIPFRAIRNEAVGADMYAQRSRLMGHLVLSGRGAVFEITAAMEAGEHLGMLVDQRLNDGMLVPFFGRPAWTNPLPARFARWFECPVHGARAIRRPDGRLHIELTPPIEMPRDKYGRVDVAAATRVMTGIVEGWVREHPDQYFWLHDRWKHVPAG